jgi:hypothetical protein
MPQPLGTKTVGDVASWVTEQFGDIASVQIDSAKIIRWINMAILEICTRDPKAYQAKWTLSSIAGTNEYAYPVALLHTSMVKYDSRVMLHKSFELIQYETESAFTGEQGTPDYWSHHADKFYLWPVPSEVKPITVFGSAKAADVTVYGDLLPLSDRFFPRICEYVYACAQELDEDYEAAAAKRTQFEDMIKIGQNSEDAMRGAPYPQMGDPEEESWYFYA